MKRSVASIPALLLLLGLLLPADVNAQGTFNPCLNNPCLNGGTCFQTLDSFMCECLPGFTGTTCNLLSPCPENTFVQDNSCVACPADTTNAEGDDPSGPDTACDATTALDHFKCYKTFQLWPRFQSRDVALVDQFADKLTRVMRPVSICNPADKNDEGMIDPSAHLTCFSIRDVEHDPPFEPRDVVVENQFGEQTLTVTGTQSLCVPSEKNGEPSDLNVDHFKCYGVDHSGFEPLTVTLEDQFENLEAVVEEPVSICNPVDKNSEGIIDPSGHLTCYSIRNAGPWWKQWFRWRRVGVENQFGEQRLLAVKRETLCVPSQKTDIAACSDTSCLEMIASDEGFSPLECKQAASCETDPQEPGTDNWSCSAGAFVCDATFNRVTGDCTGECTGF